MEQTKTIAMAVMISVLILCIIIMAIFERKNHSVKKLMLTCVLTSISIVSRLIFAVTPGFKPVSAMVMITGMYLGCESGFYCGAMTALITNFYFGQGSYTPFQMLAWGVIGIISGLFSKVLRKSKPALILSGAVFGALFSLIMDVYSTVWTFGKFSINGYFVMLASSFSFTVIYAVSNVIFLLALSGPVGRKLEHTITKYSVCKTC